MSALLELRNLTMEFQLRAGLFAQLVGASERRVRAVDGVSLMLAPGETLALVGESGSGKTTTGRIATLQERPSAGRVVFGGADVTALAGAALKRYRRDVQMIFQNPYEALDPRLTVGASIAEPLELHAIGTPEERRARVAESLVEVELRPAASFAERYPADLSGGQLQRVAIARALILRPRLVVADEPVSMLDVSVRAGVINLMLELQRRLGVSYLAITHDLAIARAMSSRIAVMYLGAIVEEGPTETLIARAAHPYTRLLVAAVPEHRAGSRRSRIKLPGDAYSEGGSPQGCRFHTRCPLAVPICRETTPPRVAIGEAHWSACHRAAEVGATGLSILNHRHPDLPPHMLRA
jgi:oligopeptide/dipeptide ABC transporter ATP-binding protein